MKISVVVCTKNEQKNIGRCLASVQKVADEIIVMDSFSNDDTEKICKSFPKVQFHQMQWLGFSQTKNQANSLATGDYILSLDADEELSPELQEEILQIKDKLQGVYSINRITNYCGQWIKHSGWFPDRHYRLFPRGKALWQGNYVHETLSFDKSLPVSDLIGLAPHYSYYSIEDHVKRIETYSSLGALQINLKKKRFLLPSVVFNPIARFMKCYVFKLGFLDGFYGLVIAALSAKAVFLKYFKAYKLQKSQGK